MIRLIIFLCALILVGCKTAEQLYYESAKTLHSGGYISVSNKTATPLYKLFPRYPDRAYSNRVEGFVKIQFDISPEGFAKNLQVIESSPIGGFDKSALENVV